MTHARIEIGGYVLKQSGPGWVTGPKIDRDGLLRYVVSYRNHHDFHETCVERMFLDLMAHCAPERLLVHAHYLRRGGIDINPYRSTQSIAPDKLRLWRQ